MMQSFYYHGDDVPATGLNVGQLRAASADPAGVLWVDLEAPTPEEIESVVKGVVGAHPLTIADCQDTAAWPKLTDFGSYVFMVAYALAEDAEGASTSVGPRGATGLALYLGNNYVVTVRHSPLAAVAALRETITRDVGMLAQGADRLAAELLGQTATGELAMVEAMANELEVLEAAVFNEAGAGQVRQLCALQGRLAVTQRQLAAQQHMLHALLETPLVRSRPENRLYFRAAHDRLTAAAERVDALRASVAVLAASQQSLAASRLMSSVLWLARVAALLALLVLVGLLIAYGPELGAIIGP